MPAYKLTSLPYDNMYMEINHFPKDILANFPFGNKSNNKKNHIFYRSTSVLMLVLQKSSSIDHILIFSFLKTGG